MGGAGFLDVNMHGQQPGLQQKDNERALLHMEEQDRTTERAEENNGSVCVAVCALLAAIPALIGS